LGRPFGRAIAVLRVHESCQEGSGTVTGVFGQFLAGIIVLAVIFVLVRPNSQGPKLVTNVADGLSNLVNAGTGGGGWSAK
jgi:hypothetical protein